MKFGILLSLLLSLFCAQTGWAYSDVLARKVFVTEDDSGNKKYLAWMDDDRFHPDDWLIVFGYKSGKLQVRHFDGQFFMFRKGEKLSLKETFYQLDLAVTSDKEDITVKLSSLRDPADARYKKTLKYKKVDSQKLSDLAEKAGMMVMDEFERQLDYKQVDSLDHLKKILDLYERMTSSYDNEFEGIPFPVEDLQIEAYFAKTAPDAEMAAVTRIDTVNGTDAISKKFREGKRWSHPDHIPWDSDWERYTIDDGEYQTFTYFNTGRKIEGWQDKLMVEAAKKYVKYEVINVTGFECEDSYINNHSYTWIFIDGSSFSYSPGLECD